MCASTWCPQLAGVVGDLAADGDVHYCLPLSPLPPAGVPVLIVVLDEAGTQDLWLAVQDDDERPPGYGTPSSNRRAQPACLFGKLC